VRHKEKRKMNEENKKEMQAMKEKIKVKRKANGGSRNGLSQSFESSICVVEESSQMAAEIEKKVRQMKGRKPNWNAEQLVVAIERGRIEKQLGWWWNERLK